MEHRRRTGTIVPRVLMTDVLTSGCSGKVREMYKIDDRTLLMVVTDRVSAFDTPLSTGVPDKGAILCQMSSQSPTLKKLFTAK